MNTTIDDKIYELATKPENFEFAWDINEKFDDIKERLQHDFLQLLYKKSKSIDECLFIRGEKWMFIIKHPNDSIIHSFFSFKGDNWIKIGIGIDSSNTDNVKAKFYEHFSDLFNKLGYNQIKVANMDCFQYGIIDINNLSNFKKILSNNREKTAEEFIDLYKVHYDELAPLILNFKLE